MEFTTDNPSETETLGQKIGASLKGGEVIALVGDLGAGKTTFVRGLAKGLGIDERITSPTFILMKSYQNLHHLDLYRLEDNLEEEVRNLGLTEIWEKDKNIVVIEWAERIRSILPENTVWITFENITNDSRKISIKGI